MAILSRGREIFSVSPHSDHEGTSLPFICISFGLILIFLAGFFSHAALIFVGHPPQGVTLYWSLLFFIGTLWAFKIFVHYIRQIHYDRYTLTFIGVAAIGLLSRYYNVDYFSIWMDEYTQYTRVLTGNILASAIVEHQMPLSYFMSYLSFHIWGWNPIGPRFFPLIWGGLSCGLFFVLCQTWLKSYAWSLFGATVFLINPWLIRFSHSGRPIALAVFTGLLFLFSFSLFLNSNTKKYAISLLALSTFVFLSATSLQPLIVVAVLGVSTWLFLRRSPLKTDLYKALITQFGVFVLLLPVYFELLSKAPDRFRDHWTTSLIQILSSLNIVKIYPYFFEILAHFGVLLPVIAFIYILIYLVYKKELDQTFLCQTHILLIFTIIFPLIFWLFFKTAIEWDLFHRYFLSAQPVFLLATLVLAQRLFLFAKSKKESIGGKLFSSVLYCGFFAPLALGVYNLPKAYSTYNYFRPHIEWKHIYKFIDKKAQSGDLLSFLNLKLPDQWHPPGFVSSEFYLKRKDLSYIKFRKASPTSDDLLIRHYQSNKKISNMFFVFYYPPPPIKKWLKNEFHEIKIYQQSAVVKVPVKKNIRLTLNQFLDEILNLEIPQNYLYRVFELKFRMKASEGDNIEALILFNKLGSLGLKKGSEKWRKLIQEIQH